MLRIAVLVLAVAGTGTDEGRAVPDKGVDAPPDKGSRTSPGQDSADAIWMARLLLALSSDVTATDDEAMRTFSTGSSSFALTPLGVDALPDKSVGAPLDKGVGAPPDKGVDAPPDKGSRTSPGKDSAGTIKVARLLLGAVLGCNGDRRRSHESLLDRPLVVRHPERSLSYRSSKGNGLPSTRSK